MSVIVIQRSIHMYLPLTEAQILRLSKPSQSTSQRFLSLSPQANKRLLVLIHTNVHFIHNNHPSQCFYAATMSQALGMSLFGEKIDKVHHKL